MTALHTFRYGGIQLPDGKFPVDFPILNAFLPTDAIIPLRQHAGPPAKRIVEPGEFIREGQLVGKASGASSVNIHSPIPGRVGEIRRIPDVMGGQIDAITVALEGSFERLGKKTERFPWKNLNKHQLLRIISDKGLVEDEGTGNSLYERLHDPNGSRSSPVLLVNCIESDPWNRSASAILIERADAIQEGMEILGRILSPGRTVLAMDRLDAASWKASGGGASPEGEEVFVCESLYPQDLPGLLQEAILGRKAALEDVFVVSVSDIVSIYDAIVLDKPQIERYVTVSGDAIKNPSILRVRIGTSIGELLEECGGFLGAPESILVNGPLRGSAVADLDLPILKTTRSVIALTKDATNRARMTACLRCGRCVLACPERLDPSRLYKHIVRGAIRDASKEGLERCTECGTCAYLCPSRIPLAQAFALAKRSEGSRTLETEGRTS